ncbi:MAG TPA: GNAT family N-acetyltransferase, partial [Nocardioidaceae bacterium]
AGPRHPVVVAEVDGRVVGCAWLDPYSANTWYADVAEFSVYVEEGHRLGGLATLLVGAVVEAGRSAGVRKVTAKVLAGNRASRRMCASLGFREVGVHLRHGRLDERWRDVVIVERLLDDVTG